MVNPKILQYIVAQLERGDTKETIITYLKAGGYPEADIEAAFIEAVKSFDQLKSSKSFTPVTQFIPPEHPHTFLRVVGIFILLAIISFSGFSILYNAGIVDTTGLESLNNLPPEPTSTPRTAVPTTAPPMIVYKAPSFPTNKTFVASGNVSADEKNQVATALLTLKTVLGSSNASGIRNYLQTISNDADAQKFSAMNDSEIFTYATQTLPSLSLFTPDNLVSSSVIWNKVDANTIEVTIGGVKNVSHQISGVWY